MAIFTDRDFVKIGELLAGKRWKAWLAGKLNRSPQQIIAYAKGRAAIPTNIRSDMLWLLDARSREIEEMRRKFSQ